MDNLLPSLIAVRLSEWRWTWARFHRELGDVGCRVSLPTVYNWRDGTVPGRQHLPLIAVALGLTEVEVVLAVHGLGDSVNNGGRAQVPAVATAA